MTADTEAIVIATADQVNARLPEADASHTAGGTLTAPPEKACGQILVAGHSSIIDCALPTAHRGHHESVGGSSWDA